MYNHAFSNIRQLAIYLRAAIHTKTEENVKRIYSWGFIWSIRLWSGVVQGGAEMGDSKLIEVLKPLVYPLVQVVLGVMR